MDKKFLVETESLLNNSEDKFIVPNMIKITNDNLVNDFLNKNVSLESLIENEIYSNKL